MEGSTRIGRIGLAGYPGYIFLQKIRYGYGPQRYDEKRTILHNWYSALRAHLPVIYRIYDDGESYRKKKEDYTKIIKPLTDAVAVCLEKARATYLPRFEIQEQYDPLEQEYERLLQDIQERLDDITAISGIIDKAKVDEGEVGVTFG